MIARVGLLLLWLLPAGAAVLAAAYLCRRATGWRLRPVLAAGGAGALAVAVAWILVRGIGLAAASDPLDWVGGSTTAHQAITSAGVLAAVLALVFGIAVVVAAWRAARQGGRTQTSHPHATAAAGLALLATLVVLVVSAVAPAQVQPLVGSLAEPIAAAPLVATGLALYLLAPLAREPEDEAPAAPPTAMAAPTATADPEAVLRRASLIQGNPTITSPGRRGTATADAEGRVWTACGGAGGPPKALRAILDGLGQRSRRLLVGDLPIDTEESLVAALVSLLVAGRAGRALVVCANAEAVASRVQGVLDGLGVPRTGTLVSRAGVLKEALARGEAPALVCLDLGELSGGAIEVLGSQAHRWLALVDLIVLVRVDQLLPIQATHLAFTLQRLSIALATHRSDPTWVALGDGSLGTRGFLQTAVNHKVESLPLGADSAADVRIFVRRVSDRLEQEVEAHARALAAAGIDFHIEDAVGLLGERAAALVADAARVTRRPGYHGRCALAILDDRDLPALFRGRGQLAHQCEADGRHLGCWWVKDTPLARFLLVPGNLEGLEHDGQLPSPRPVAGFSNPFLAAAHLEAALNEGHPDEAALRLAFGDHAVDELRATQQDVREEGARARWDRDERVITRSPILTRPGERWVDERRETVTREVVEIRSRDDGSLLRRADELVAPTRFYPHRVFQAKGAMFRVGESPAGRRITASSAEARAVPTKPQLRFKLDLREWQEEAERYTFDRVTVARRTADVRVHESVSGAVPLGAAAPTVQYAPVEAEYESTAAVIFFLAATRSALIHVARVVDMILPAHLLADDEDIEVWPFPDGFGGVERPALVFIDRNVGGIGVAQALDARTIRDLLTWTWGVLHTCPCMDGCEKCTPGEVVARGPDKQGALRLLGG